jgi:hypothetical protein
MEHTNVIFYKDYAIIPMLEQFVCCDLLFNSELAAKAYIDVLPSWYSVPKGVYEFYIYRKHVIRREDKHFVACHTRHNTMWSAKVYIDELLSP